MELKINLFDTKGVVIGDTTVEMTQEQIEDIVNHAVQLTVIQRSGRRSSGDTDSVLYELEEAVCATDIPIE